MTKNNRLNELMSRYIQGSSTRQEEQELASLIMLLKDEDLDKELISQLESFNVQSQLSDNKTDRILSQILSDKKSRKPFILNSRRIYLQVASAAAVLIFVFSVGLYKQTPTRQTMAVAVKANIISAEKPTNYTRTLILPDKSTVILKAGSTLHYPTSFAGTTREVVLNGEAYFDVKHMNSKPFIIHTGVVKTTVLGTAFDIKAWPDQKNVTVSVTRGKVRVEDNRKVLAVLTVNQQASYDLLHTAVKQQKVNAEEIVIDWAKEDLHFEGATLESIAQVLSNRYGKNIRISSVHLAKTQIVSSFVGTESLENILEVLCVINRNAQFVEKNNEIVISENN